jgi:hypothetical protein
MKILYRVMFLLPITIVLALGAASVQPQQKSTTDQDVIRGKYLVEEVAKCPECHTPRNENHELDPDRWLQGATIWIQPAFKTTNWAQFAPPLAGLANYTDEQAERVLEKGQGAGGSGPIQPPMHVYHLNHADAKATIAYLRSL